MEKFMQRTLAMIKPDAMTDGHENAIRRLIAEHEFTIVAELRIAKLQAARFYAEHRDRPFFDALVEFMMSGPVVALVLERHDAIAAWRSLMGATDSSKAASGTIRQLYGSKSVIYRNAVHGSDSAEAVAREIDVLFGAGKPDASHNALADALIPALGALYLIKVALEEARADASGPSEQVEFLTNAYFDILQVASDLRKALDARDSNRDRER